MKPARVIADRDGTGLTVRIAGRGLDLGRLESPVIDANGNEIVWREMKRRTDQLGNVHIRYRQFLVGDGFEAELVGSSMLTHWTADGALESVDGVQFEKVKLLNRPALAPQAAMDRAARIAARFGEQPIGADLKLVPEGDAFRFVYYTRAVGEDGAPLRVVIDAESEEVLDRAMMSAPGNCSSTGLGDAMAVIDPVRPELPLRPSIWVTRDWRGNGFVHEASFDYGAKITAFQQVLDNPDTTFSLEWKCDPTQPRSYSVVPVRADDGSTTPLVFRDRPSGDDRPWQGSVAGDAYWNTYQTIRTFVGFGRDGWDDEYGDANIVVDAEGNPDLSVFNYHGAETAAAPYNAVIVRRERDFYSMAASLDNIAHEWGHGVILSDDGWEYSRSSNPTAEQIVQRQLHEGWSDVVAMIVEKRRQPSGWYLEEDSDWTLHEDSGASGYARGASDDYGSHNWKGKPREDGTAAVVRKINDKVHRLDNYGNHSDPGGIPFSDHSYGNMLNVVHMLMSDGGTNSACGRLFQSCPSVTGIGSSKAGLILFQALQNRVGSHHRWETMMDPVKEEAFAQYNSCSYDRTLNAAAEQLAVINAFKNIGYPGLNPTVKPCP